MCGCSIDVDINNTQITDSRKESTSTENSTADTKTNQKEVYAKITVLNNNEHPLEQIEGKILDGSINVDGKSVIRRTCNLSMIADNVNLNSFYWGLKNKFILEVGLKNSINKSYPDIVWFKQGLFIITQFNTT